MKLGRAPRTRRAAVVEQQAAEQVHGLLRAGGEEDLLGAAADAAHRHQLDDLGLERLMGHAVLERARVGGQQPRGGLGQLGHREELGRRQPDREGQHARTHRERHHLPQP
jgi:hypothetical protein